MKKLITIILLLVSSNAHAKSLFPPECPLKGNGEIIQEPERWADNCFQAINGRAPEENFGESMTIYKDINLDGVNERLEIRGTGNSIKQIYIFSITKNNYRYMGELNAHPQFKVKLNLKREPVILNTYRAGSGDIYTQEIQYKENEFSVVNEISVKSGIDK